jgi:PhnB protein
MTTINPYLTFNGDCKLAFNFYKSIFGGEFPYVGRFKDMPKKPEHELTDGDMNKIMHISLPISKETVLMGSDSSEAFGKATISGNNFSISINTDSIEEATRLFDALSEGGQITMPMNKVFWGSHFGMLIDPFKIQWMISFSDEKIQH